MVKYLTTNSLFKFTWDQVAIGLWQRYPNPNSNHVLTEDVISRHVDDDKLVTRRIITKTNKIPRWAERIVGRNKNVLVVEESVVDLTNKTITTYTRNVGMQKAMSVEEKCVYKVSSENLSWTICYRAAWISSRLFGVSSAIEIFGVKRFRNNATKATQGFDYVLTHLFKSDLLKVHPLSPSHKLMDTTRKAAEMAKSKASPILPRATS